MDRVAIAQGKHLKKHVCFYKGIHLQHRENFEVLKIKGCATVVVRCCYDLLAIVGNLS